MRRCGLALYITFSMIQIIYSREYARPSPTDMPYSSRDILNQKEDMKAYLKALKSFKVARPDLFNGTCSLGNLLVEDEKIRIPPSIQGLSEVTKMYLDQNKLSRYLKILDMELQRTPATIELDSSKIIDYVKMLNNMNKHDGKSADLVSRSRIKLMKGGITENIMEDVKGRQQEADLYNDYEVNRRDADSIENVDDKSIYATADKSEMFFNSDLAGEKPEESLNEDSISQKPAGFERDQSANQNINSENYDLNSDLSNQLEANNKQSEAEKKTLPEIADANALNEDEPNNNAEQSEQGFIENLQIQQSSATEYSGVVSVGDVESNVQDTARKNNEFYLPIKVDILDGNEKPVANSWLQEKDNSVHQSPFDSMDVPVPINHMSSKDFVDRDDKTGYVNGEGDIGLNEPKPEERMMADDMSYGNGKKLESNPTDEENDPESSLVKNNHPGEVGSMLKNLQNKLMEKPIDIPKVILGQSHNVPYSNNPILRQQYLQNLLNKNMDTQKASDIKTDVLLRNSNWNHPNTEPPLNSDSSSSGLPNHVVFPLKPGDEVVNLPKIKSVEQSFNNRNKICQFSRGMPTKPPKMFSKYYISRLKKFQKYDDDSNSLNFLKQPRLPLFGTKENEVSKIINVNLDHLHIDKGALYKIIGKALKIDEDNNQEYAPPKWLENKYEELLHASHRGQNFNDYDYIERSMHILNHNFNIRDRKETAHQSNRTSL